MSTLPRQSNLELLRIVAMMLIVAHHYVVNSTALSCFVDGQPVSNYIFLRVIGDWGKMAINPFIILSGYFMSTTNLTAKRYCKVFLEWIFYSYVVFFILAVFGYERICVERLARLLFPFFDRVNVGFLASFVWFYLGIPVYNVIIKNLDKRGFAMLNFGLLAMFIIPITFFKNGTVFHHVFWYMTLYFVGAYIRYHPASWMTNQKLVSLSLVAGCFLVITSIIGRLLFPCLITKIMVNVCAVFESSTLFSFILGVLFFLFFKNLNIGYHKWINMMASCMFGVLCIHAASDSMRVWLWQYVCHVPEVVCAPLSTLVAHAVGCVLAVIIVGALIDLLRQHFVEPIILKKIH